MRRLFIPYALLAVTAAPLAFVLVNARGSLRIDSGSLVNSLLFACGGALVALLVGATEALILGTALPRRAGVAIAIPVVPLAAPIAFWWIGLQRLIPQFATAFHGLAGAATISGIVLSPVPFLLFMAALGEVPTASFEAARVALPPLIRLTRVLLPMLRGAIVAGFLLTAVILMGESEVPFLFGFRTAMTDVVTEFARTFDASQVAPMIVPMMAIVIALTLVMRKALIETLLAPSRGALGVTPRRRRAARAIVAPIAAFLICSVAGHLSGLGAVHTSRIPGISGVAAVSVLESIGWSWLIIAGALAIVYPLRRSAHLRAVVSVSVVLFAAPAAFFAIGWAAFSQSTGYDVPVGVAHFCRLIGLGVIAFAAAYTRIPRSLDDAALLVPVSAITRAHRLILPLLASSATAVAVLITTMILSDRDVASVLLPPGSERLTLDFYLAAANAPTFIVSTWAAAVLVCAIVAAAVSAAGPWLLWRQRA